jgi:hypothetical protein
MIMSVSTAIIWLKVASAILMIGLGLITALSAFPALATPATLSVDILFWPLDGAQSLGANETRLMLAIGGGITFGWGLLVWQVAGKVMPASPEIAKSILTNSLIGWFLLDSFCSWLAGAPLNIAANLALFAAFMWPLLQIQPVKSTVSP